MKNIYKYPIEITDAQTILMPEDSKVIHVGFDPNDTPCIWTEVDTSMPLYNRLFFVVGTSHPVPDATNARHLGSFVADPFVWHVYGIVN